MTIKLSDRNLDELWNESIHKGWITEHLDDGDRIRQGYLRDLFKGLCRKK